MRLSQTMQQELNYTDHQMKLIKYALKTFFSEASKFIIIGIPFLILNQYKFYLCAMVLLFLLRRYGGGIHCKTYIGCLLCSFIYAASVVLFLPLLILPDYIQYILMAVCLVVSLLISPVPSIYHAPLQKRQIICYKTIVLLAIAAEMILMSLLSKNPYIKIAFWVIVVHTTQLTISYMQRRKKK